MWIRCFQDEDYINKKRKIENIKIKVINIGCNIKTYLIEEKYSKNVELIEMDKPILIDDKFRKNLEEADLIFVVFKMNNKKEIRIVHLIGKILKEIDSLTIGIVTNYNENTILELKNFFNTIITIPNKISKNFSKISYQIVNRIIDSFFNELWDFDDLKVLIKQIGGRAGIAISHKSGINSAYEAFIETIKSPLLDNIDIMEAKGLLIHTIINENYLIFELDEAMESVLGELIENEKATIIFNEAYDNSFADGEIEITIIAFGF